MSIWVPLGNSGLALLAGDPGSAILVNGVLQSADREIGLPEFQPEIPKSTSEFKFTELFRIATQHLRSQP